MLKRVAIINAVYPPEPVVSAQMGRDLAVEMTRRGAEVTVICPFPTRPIGARYSAYIPNGSIRVEVEDGVKVVRLPSFTAPESRFVGRMRESRSFGRHVCDYLEKHPNSADVIYANTWPLFSQAVIARYCARRGIPLVLHIQDLYPEALLGKLPRWCRRIVGFPLSAMDRAIAQKTHRVVTISETMRRKYVESRRIAPEKVVMISNWADENCFTNLPGRREACLRYGVPADCFTFLYLGNIGPVAGVEDLIRAFHMAKLDHAQLVVAGDGSSKVACVELAKSIGVSGVSFISDPDIANVPLLQSLGHVCLLPLRKGAGMSSIPSKLIAYLFSAKPVLATIDAGSDTARCIEEGQCGWVGEPENVQWLASKMAEVAALPTGTLEAMGKRGRAYGLANYSKATGVQKLANVVLGANLSRQL